MIIIKRNVIAICFLEFIDEIKRGFVIIGAVIRKLCGTISKGLRDNFTCVVFVPSHFHWQVNFNATYSGTAHIVGDSGSVTPNKSPNTLVEIPGPQHTLDTVRTTIPPPWVRGSIERLTPKHPPPTCDFVKGLRRNLIPWRTEGITPPKNTQLV